MNPYQVDSTLSLWSCLLYRVECVFQTAFYSVLEGEFLQIALQTNKHFKDPFTINVTIVEGTAVGKCLAHILHNTQYTADKALLIIRNTYI